MRAFMKLMLVAVALAMAVVALGGCEQDSYCLDCHKASHDGGSDDVDGGDGGVIDDGGPRPDACVPSGTEVCDGIDNDCNGIIDDNVPEVGTACQVGAHLPCTQGTTVCTSGHLSCGGGAVLPASETCNNIDDDCDGVVDDGNPGGGILCGIAEGDCQQGTTRCQNGGVICFGEVGPTPEICDNRDNDCDGVVDNGNPGGGAACGADTGSCVAGLMMCSGGVIRCQGAVGPTLETCNMTDDDCDGVVDNGFNLQTDRRNCGMCGHICTAPFATTKCTAGGCAIAFCDSGHFDLNGLFADGCEYACNFNGAEICNGLDDDCDGQVDEGVTVPAGLCLTLGACGMGTGATCAGTAGWDCNYPATVSTDAMGNIVPEVNCDNIDNDCDGTTDETFPTKGDTCADSGLGVCQRTGTLVCNGGGNGVTCNLTSPVVAASREICNGKDDDCNGTVDDNNPIDGWIDISGGAIGMNKWIYKYEASRPDATPADEGTASARSCAQPGVLPWTNVTYPQAEAACSAAGGRLCTETEWQRACQTSGGNCTWSYNATCTTYSASTCNGNDFDFDSGTPGNQDGLKTAGSLAACYANWGSTANRVFDMSGNAKEWAAAATGDPANTRRLRGGSYNNTKDGIACAFRFAVADSTFEFPNVGFRCCRDTAPPQ